MVAVYGNRHGCLIFFCQHKLENSHLCCGILERNAVGSGFDIGFTRLKLGLSGVIKMSVEDLFTIGQWASQPFPDNCDIGCHIFIGGFYEGGCGINRCVHVFSVSML